MPAWRTCLLWRWPWPIAQMHSRLRPRAAAHRISWSPLLLLPAVLQVLQGRISVGALLAGALSRLLLETRALK